MPFLSPCALRIFCVFLYRLRLIDPSLSLRQQAWREALMAGPHREPPPGEREQSGGKNHRLPVAKSGRVLRPGTAFRGVETLPPGGKKEPGNFAAQSNLGNVLARVGRTGLSAPTQGRFYSLTLANAQIQACGSNLPLLGAGTLRLWWIRESRTNLPQHWGKAWRLYPRTPSTTRDGAR